MFGRGLYGGSSQGDLVQGFTVGKSPDFPFFLNFGSQNFFLCLGAHWVRPVMEHVSEFVVCFEGQYSRREI